MATETQFMDFLLILSPIAIPFSHKCLFFFGAKHIDQQELKKNACQET